MAKTDNLVPFKEEECTDEKEPEDHTRQLKWMIVDFFLTQYFCQIYFQ